MAESERAHKGGGGLVLVERPQQHGRQHLVYCVCVCVCRPTSYFLGVIHRRILRHIVRHTYSPGVPGMRRIWSSHRQCPGFLLRCIQGAGIPRGMNLF